MSTSGSKNELRHTLRARRRALTASAQRIAADRLTRHVLSTRAFRTNRRIAVYAPTDGEIDPGLILGHGWRLGKSMYLPILARTARDRLWFAPVTPATAFAPNRYGIPEPVVATHQLVRADGLDLILLPLVAFDTHGHRLGMGGGYYDRSLAFLRTRRHWRKPRLLGLAHDFQKVARLPADPWDITLTAIATDVTVHESDFAL